jgi:hypothetical protein
MMEGGTRAGQLPREVHLQIVLVRYLFLHEASPRSFGPKAAVLGKGHDRAVLAQALDRHVAVAAGVEEQLIDTNGAHFSLQRSVSGGMAAHNENHTRSSRPRLGPLDAMICLVRSDGLSNSRTLACGELSLLEANRLLIIATVEVPSCLWSSTTSPAAASQNVP